MFDQLLVLGQVPGTNLIITFNQVLLASALIILIIIRPNMIAQINLYPQRIKQTLKQYHQKRRQLSLPL